MTSMADLDLWKRVATDERLLSATHGVDPGSVSEMGRLRKTWSPDEIRVALELADARRRGREKFARASEMLADREGLEQASSEVVADYKARRVATLDDCGVLDLCCGVGGDAMSLGRLAPTVAVDRDPIRAWMAQENARLVDANVSTVVDDVENIDVDGRIVHIDPSRRGGGRRKWKYADYEPGAEFLHDLCSRAKACAVKLGPGVDTTEITEDGEIEFIADRGTLVQAVLWTGELADGVRSATRLPDGVRFVGVPADVTRVSEGAFRKYLYEPHVALERARLVGAHPRADVLEEPAAGLGLYTTDARLDDWFTGFEVQEVMPWREREVAAWLRDHDAGIVEVKTRGGAVDPEKARRALSQAGSIPFSVFVLRLGRALRAVITLRRATLD